MNGLVHKIVGVMAALVLAGGLVACSGDSGDSGGSGGSAGDPAGSEQAADDSGSDPGDGELPSWIADNFPLPPNAGISSVSDGGGATIVAMTVSGDEATLKSWFTDQYSTDGWTIDREFGDGDALTAEHADGYSAVVRLTIMSTVSIVTLTASK